MGRSPAADAGDDQKSYFNEITIVDMNKAGAAAMLLFLCAVSAHGHGAFSAVEQDGRVTAGGKIPESGWYAGIEGGVPFGFSTFSSFGHDRLRTGLDAGLFGGYRFSPVVSAELSLRWGWTSMSARGCCAQSGYWLGGDGGLYYAPVLDIPSLKYSDLFSRTSFQQYGAALNVNIFGLFSGLRDSRWTLDLSPHLYAVATGTTVREADGGGTFRDAGTAWHFGYGGNIQAGYRLTERIRLALYSGLTAYTGDRIDAMPKHNHSGNMLWESGVRLSVALGDIFAGRGDSARPSGTGSDTSVSAPGISTAPDSSAAPVRTNPEPCAPDAVVRTEQPETSVPCAPDTTAAPQAPTSPQPHLLGEIHFANEEWTVPQSQYEALQAILEQLRQNPDAQVVITGWCDHYGTDAVNMRISQLRADSVKAWLARRGISRARMEAVGRGVDRDEPVRSKARRVSVHIMVK